MALKKERMKKRNSKEMIIPHKLLYSDRQESLVHASDHSRFHLYTTSRVRWEERKQEKESTRERKVFVGRFWGSWNLVCGNSNPHRIRFLSRTIALRVRFLRRIISVLIAIFLLSVRIFPRSLNKVSWYSFFFKKTTQIIYKETVSRRQEILHWNRIGRSLSMWKRLRIWSQFRKTKIK